MTIEIKVPALPESVTDATLVAWHKKAGDRVSRDDNLVDLETDKVVLEVPAPASGVLTEILKSSGETVLSEEVLARIDPAATAAEAPAAAAPAAAAPAPVAEPAAAAPELSPAVRKLVAEHGLDPHRPVVGVAFEHGLPECLGDVLGGVGRGAGAEQQAGQCRGQESGSNVHGQPSDTTGIAIALLCYRNRRGFPP